MINGISYRKMPLFFSGVRSFRFKVVLHQVMSSRFDTSRSRFVTHIQSIRCTFAQNIKVDSLHKAIRYF